MFNFDAIDESLYSHVSPDRVPDAMKKSFSMVFGSDQLDNRLQVILSERQIGFFFYDCDYGNQGDGTSWKPGETMDNDYVKEVGFITLTRAKDVGNDMLDFPQNIENITDLYDCQSVLKSMHDCVLRWKKEFLSFPFIDAYSDDGNSTLGEETFRCFLRCCLLDFIYDYEDRWQAFGSSPLYDNVRDKLRESDVYRMLAAKLNYIQYINKGFVPRNREKYTFHAKKYADCLMSTRLNKVILPNNYGNSEGKQGWFYDPERELDFILQKERDFNQLKSSENSDVASLNESLVSKMRSFFYTKHSVYRANTSEKGKKWFKHAQWAMFVFNVFSVVALLFYEKAFCDLYYNGLYLIGLLGVVIVGGSIWLSAKHNRGEKVNAFFPRIIVAESAAWLTIGIAEDLVKSMLWTKRVWIALLLVLILVGVLIYSEAKQHSPYLNWKDNVKKTLLVMNHSVFFALILGGITQSVFYDKLLRTSNVLSDVVYKKHFDEVENYIQQLEGLEKSINEYQKFAQDYYMSLSDMGGDNSGQVKLEKKAIGVNDTLSIVYDNKKLVLQSTFPSSSNPTYDVVQYHASLVNAVNTQKDNLSTMMIRTSCDSVKDFFAAFFCDDLQESDSINLKNDIRNNYNMTREMLLAIHREIQVSKKHCKDDGYNTLLDWTTVNISNNETDSPYLNMLIKNDKNAKCCRVVGWGVPNNEHRFYPTLLLMHTLIVLVIAFITQLIISDKSVTEPL